MSIIVREREVNVMDKIYGFKQKDIEQLIGRLENRKEKPLSRVFEEFAEQTGKSKGTVRNMYYALAKKSREDGAFADKYLGGKPISVQKIAEFKEGEERELIKKVLLGRKEGKSARRVIHELAEGDEKKALRFQNKYRNVLKHNQPLLGELSAEIRSESGVSVEAIGVRSNTKMVSDVMLKRLQNEINALIDRISGKLKRENAYLRSRLGELEVENMRLKNVLYGDGGKTARYFNNGGEEKLIH